MAEKDLRFLVERAREYIESRAWEALGAGGISLRLKAGSWYEACAQAVHRDAMNVVFLFPGRRDLRALQEAGMGEPPAGTVFAELHKPEPGFAVITPQGWMELDRLQSRLMALALAALRHVAAAPVGEASGELILADGVRGRYTVLRTPPRADEGQLLAGIPRFDLYGDDKVKLSWMNLSWLDYESVRQRARHSESVGDQFKDVGDLIPVVVLSGKPELASGIAQRLRDSQPRGITFGQMGRAFTALVGGLNDTYVLWQTIDDREGVLRWRHGVKTLGGAHAIIVSESTPTPTDDPWRPASVDAVFEFGRQR